MNKTTVLCVGELLIDMFCTDKDIALKDGESFKKLPGGAPANVAVTITKLGGESALIGKVGNDSFGDFLIETLQNYNVDTSLVSRDEYASTTIAFVSLTAFGERDFQFNQGADKNLRLEDVHTDLDKIKIVHLGSATALLDGDLNTTYFELLKIAYTKKKFISFDPNFREDLWKNHKELFIQRAKSIICYSNLVKVSEEELKLLTGQEEIVEGAEILHKYGGKIVLVTLGKKGSFLSMNGKSEFIPSKDIDVIDSTGAGDAFIGAIIYKLSKIIEEKGNIGQLDFNYFKDIVLFANNVGAEVCTKMGALTAIPELETVELKK